MSKYKIHTTSHTDDIIRDAKMFILNAKESIVLLATLDLCEIIGKIEELNREINRSNRREYEVYKEVRDYAYSLCTTTEDKILARAIIEHLATYLLFNMPIRKSDK